MLSDRPSGVKRGRRGLRPADRVGSCSVGKLDEKFARLDLMTDDREQLGDSAVALGVNGRLHFHRFDGEQLLTLPHRVARVDRDADDQAGEWRADLIRVGGVGPGHVAHRRRERPVGHLDLPGKAVQFEEDGAVAVGVGLTDGQELDDDRLADR